MLRSFVQRSHSIIMQIKKIAKKLGKALLWGIAAYFLLISVLLLIFRWVPVPTSSFMIQQNISAWWNSEENSPVRYEWLAWDDLPKSAALAVIAAEDQHFPSHHGLDFHAIRAAWAESRKNKRGASTITQQVVKNLFLWSGRSYLRKGLEASISVLLEVLWSKQRILEVYLNIAQFGSQDYGVKMATKHLLKRNVDKLSFSSAALLASALPAPTYYDLSKPNNKMRKKQRWIKKQMRQLGGIQYLDKL